MEPGVPALPHAADGPDEESHGGGREEARVVPLRRRLPVLFFSLGLIFFSWPDFFSLLASFFSLGQGCPSYLFPDRVTDTSIVDTDAIAEVKRIMIAH